MKLLTLKKNEINIIDTELFLHFIYFDISCKDGEGVGV